MFVRNGAKTLSRALDTIKAQTYRNVEIILSDNDSTDATPEIMKAFAASDARARYVRQSKLTAICHWAKVASMANGKYSLFVAADDERNDVYVERLVAALDRNPAAVLAFGRLVVRRTSGLDEEVSLDFENASVRIWRRLQLAAWRDDRYICYGLWRTATLQAMTIRECAYAPDMQVMMSASCRGTFVRDDAAVFLYRDINKSPEEAAQYQSFVRLPLFYRSGMIATSALAIAEAGAGWHTAVWGASMLAGRSFVDVVRPRLRFRQAKRALLSVGKRRTAASTDHAASPRGA